MGYTVTLYMFSQEVAARLPNHVEGTLPVGVILTEVGSSKRILPLQLRIVPTTDSQHRQIAAAAIKKGVSEEAALKQARETHQYSTQIYSRPEQEARQAVATATMGRRVVAREIIFGMRWLNTFIKQVYEKGPFDKDVSFDVEGEEAEKAFQYLWNVYGDQQVAES